MSRLNDRLEGARQSGPAEAQEPAAPTDAPVPGRRRAEPDPQPAPPVTSGLD